MQQRLRSASVEAQPLSSPRALLPPCDRVGARALVGKVRCPLHASDEDAVIVAVAKPIIHAGPRAGRRLDADSDLAAMSEASKLKHPRFVAILGCRLTEVARSGAEAVRSMIRQRRARKHPEYQCRATRHHECDPHEEPPSIDNRPTRPSGPRAPKPRALRAAAGRGP